MSRSKEIFARQCVSVARQFLDYDPETIADKIRKKSYPRKRFGGSPAVQRRTRNERVKAVMDGLEAQARKNKQVTAFKGFRRIIEAGLDKD